MKKIHLRRVPCVGKFTKTEGIKRGLFKCPHTGKVINADLNGANILHIPESVKDRGKWLKAQPVVYRWTNGAGWVTTSYEVMKNDRDKPRTYDPP